MPRGNKSTGKVATRKQTPKETKARKAYPSREERIAMADKQIDRLTKLNENRSKLIAKTEGTLAARKAALEKSAAALEKELRKKARLTATPEKLREEKKTKRTKLNELMSALDAKGMSVEDLLNSLK